MLYSKLIRRCGFNIFKMLEDVFINRLPTNICFPLWRLLVICLLPLLLTFNTISSTDFNIPSIVIFILILISLCGVAYFIQDNLLYYPDQPEHSRMYIINPAAFDSNFESVRLVTEDGVLIHGLFLKYKSEPSNPTQTVLFLHGNAGNVSHRIPNAKQMCARLEAHVLILDYRGFGKSEGTISEQGLYLDAEAGIEYLLQRPDVDRSRIILFGRSLGGAVAIHCAAQSRLADKIYMLIVENTFLSIPDAAKVLFSVPGLSFIPAFCYKNRYDSFTKINKIKMPSLFISGQADQLIPPSMMATLYQYCCASKKRMLKVTGGTHNETWTCTGYYQAIMKFMKEVASDVAMVNEAVTPPMC